MSFPEASIYKGLDYPEQPGRCQDYPAGLDERVAQLTDEALRTFGSDPDALKRAMGRITVNFPTLELKRICDAHGLTNPLLNALYPFTRAELVAHGSALQFSPEFSLDQLNPEGQWRLAIHHAKHEETTRHGVDATSVITALSSALAQELSDFENYGAEVRTILAPTLMHDHGKSEIPTALLGNPFDSLTHLPELFQDNLRDPARKQGVFPACLTELELARFQPILTPRAGAAWTQTEQTLLEALMNVLTTKRYRFGDGVPSRYILKIMERIDLEGKFTANGKELLIHPKHLASLELYRPDLPYREAMFAAHRAVLQDPQAWKHAFMDSIRIHAPFSAFSLKGVFGVPELKAIAFHHNYTDDEYPKTANTLGRHVQAIRCSDVLSALAPHHEDPDQAIRCYTSIPRDAQEVSRIFGFEAQRGLIHPDCERVVADLLGSIPSRRGHVLVDFLEAVQKKYGST